MFDGCKRWLDPREGPDGGEKEGDEVLGTGFY